MDFEPCFKVYNLVSIRPKSMKLGQMTNLNVIFHMVGSVYRLVTSNNQRLGSAFDAFKYSEGISLADFHLLSIA